MSERRAKRESYDCFPHWCQDGHERIGWSGDDHELCPICRTHVTDPTYRLVKVEDAEKAIALAMNAGGWAHLADESAGEAVGVADKYKRQHLNLARHLLGLSEQEG